jgi:hypothetical protein
MAVDAARRDFSEFVYPQVSRHFPGPGPVPLRGISAEVVNLAGCARVPAANRTEVDDEEW